VKQFNVASSLLIGGLLLGVRTPLPAGENEKEKTDRGTNPAFKIAEDDWPCWRGPFQDGKSRDRRVITKWTATDYVVWKTRVPGRGHSSPIVVGDRVFLTTADEKARKQLILGFRRKNGELLWSTVAYEGQFLPKHPKNSHASATPASDGERVYCVFINREALYVLATDFDGQIVWQTRVGSFKSQHGYGSSPVLHKSLVIVNGDSLKGSFLAALHRDNGKIAWQVNRPTTERNGSYATPVVAMLAGRAQLLLTGMGEVRSYDPDSGRLLWSCSGPAEVTACSPAFSDSSVFATGGYPEKEILAIRADGKGDVSKTHGVWRTKKGVSYVPSPIYHDASLYVIADNGIISCFDARTGKEVRQDRLEGEFSASPVLVGDLLYCTNEAGKTFIVKSGSRFEIVATNDLADGGFATPAVCGGQIFLRTNHFLYCLGNPH
jgi:outer membrane protein assembly factor BamB